MDKKLSSNKYLNFTFLKLSLISCFSKRWCSWPDNLFVLSGGGFNGVPYLLSKSVVVENLILKLLGTSSITHICLF